MVSAPVKILADISLPVKTKDIPAHKPKGLPIMVIALAGTVASAVRAIVPLKSGKTLPPRACM
jgi:hypothetical protein